MPIFISSYRYFRINIWDKFIFQSSIIENITESAELWKTNLWAIKYSFGLQWRRYSHINIKIQIKAMKDCVWQYIYIILNFLNVKNQAHKKKEKKLFGRCFVFRTELLTFIMVQYSASSPPFLKWENTDGIGFVLGLCVRG